MDWFFLKVWLEYELCTSSVPAFVTPIPNKLHQYPNVMRVTKFMMKHMTLTWLGEALSPDKRASSDLNDYCMTTELLVLEPKLTLLHTT